MKAYIIDETGGIEKLILKDVPMPVINAGEVLVKVKSIGINPVDTIVRRNHQRLVSMYPEKGNGYILGWDISGTVADGDKDWIGKDVFGMVNFPGPGRAYAEYVAAPVDHLAFKPSNISHPEAAAATLAALTAWQALVKTTGLKKGDHVLVHAAAGGVGHYAVQIARHFGASVSGTASEANRDFLLNLGLDNFIDYHSQQFETIVKPDVILDSVEDRNHLLRSIDALKEGGRLVSIKIFFDEEIRQKMQRKNISGQRIMVHSDGNDMNEIARLLETGTLKSHVTKMYLFKDLPETHQQIETRKTRGKIVVNLG